MGQIYINDKLYDFKEGETILDIARRNEIDIPVMCYLEHITPTGACRLCLIEIEGVAKPVAACVTYAIDGMKVKTNTEKVVKNRKKMMEFVLMKHPLDCPVCDKAGECMLQDTAYSFGIKEETFKTEKPAKPKFDWDMIIHDANLCVLCERCVKLCHEVAGCSALEIQERGFENIINTKNGANLSCDFCGICVDYCPVGALLDKPYKHSVRAWDLQRKQSVCTMCPVGCKIEYGLYDGEIYRATSADGGFVCSLGRYAFKYTDNPERVTTTLKKGNNEFETVDFDDSIKNVIEKVDKIKEYYGEGSVAFLVGGSLSCEDIAAVKYLADKIAGGKVVSDVAIEYEKYYNEYFKKFSTYNNIGKLPNLRDSELTFVIGADLKTESLGVKWDIMNAAVRNDGKLVTITLREPEYEYMADAALKADYGDFAGVFEKIKNSSERVYSDIREYIKDAKKISFVVGNEYMQAEKQLKSVFAFLDYAGGREKLYNFINTCDKANYISLLNIIGNEYTADSFIKELESGKIKALIVVGFDTLNVGKGYKSIQKNAFNLELIVSIGMFTDNFSRNADIFFPATGYLEQESTFVTMDNRLIRSEKIIDAPGQTYPVSYIMSRLAKIKGFELPDNNEEIFNGLLSGKYGFPEIKYSEIDGYLYKVVDWSYSNTEYVYKEFPKGTVEVIVNERYHNGNLTKKAALEKKDGEAYRKYYFDVKGDVISGEDACYDGKCTLNTGVAKGVVLIPKNA